MNYEIFFGSKPLYRYHPRLQEESNVPNHDPQDRTHPAVSRAGKVSEDESHRAVDLKQYQQVAVEQGCSMMCLVLPHSLYSDA